MIKKTFIDIKLYKSFFFFFFFFFVFFFVILLVILVMRITHNNINLNDFHSLCYFKMDLKNRVLDNQNGDSTK